jgi:1-acyl-sn-glycerol-3-phosphate acyltransferase
MWKFICRAIFRLFGWKIEGAENLSVPKAVVPVVPHTSSWDFPIGILTRGAIEKDIKFIAKSSLFKPPFGWIFRKLGGYPVDRSKRTHFVDSVIDIYNEKEEFLVSIAPEGTRAKVNKLKTGFYFIAKGANIPIVPSTFNFKTRTVYFGKPIIPSDDQEADFQKLNEFYQLGHGKNNELAYQPE